MISVCIATYNGAKYIKEQLDSILPQLNPDDEIVISDDGSTDSTIEDIKSYQDARIKIISGPALHSPCRNFENAMSHSKGDYIFLSDQDDVWLANKVSVMMKALQTSSCVVSDCYITDENLNVISDSFRQSMGFKDGKWYNLFIRNSYSGSCMAFKREIMQRANPMPEGILMHDIWLGNVAAFKYSLQFIPDKLIYFRRHSGSSSTAGGKSDNPISRRLYSRMKTAIALFLLK